jgi:hypothetical protein
MAAGLGFKTFNTGEVLTAGDVNGYLMQGVLVFASAAARDAAITSPQEGQFAYTKDTNGLWYYDGAAWVASGATGDIEGVTAGVGISGGGTSGTVTVTNSMATAITTSGDLIYGTGSGTFTRRGIGSTGDVLTVASGVPTWAAPAGGGGANFTLVNTGGTALSGSSTVSISGITNADQLLVIVDTAIMGSSGNAMDFFINGDTASNYYGTYFNVTSTATYNPAAFQSYSLQGTPPRIGEQSNNASSGISMSAYITGGNSSGQKVFTIVGGANGYGGTGQYSKIQMGQYNSSSTISSIRITSVSANWTGGTIYVYKSA